MDFYRLTASRFYKSMSVCLVINLTVPFRHFYPLVLVSKMFKRDPKTSLNKLFVSLIK